MVDAELERWLTGLPSRTGREPAVMVVAPGVAPEAAAALRDIVTGATEGRVGLREIRGVVPGHQPGSADEYAGRFEPEGDVVFGDGLRLRVRHYGSAPFVCLDGPTTLVIRDEDDFSAYLRDADDAWLTGRFAEHATHPQSVIADLAALGGPASDAGPARRSYLGEDNLVRTSPAGGALGAPAHGLAALVTRWQRLNAASAWPDACCLAGSVPDGDRIAALQDRPWIRRYVTAVLAVRAARRSDRVPCRVSGFGGRLTSGLDGSPRQDDGDAPVLVQIGGGYRALDPVGSTSVGIDDVTLRALELLLVDGAGSRTPAADEACALLLGAGVARDWCLRQHAGAPDATGTTGGAAATGGPAGPAGRSARSAL